MHTFTLFAALRNDITQAEEAVAQAWEHYQHTISPEALTQVITATQQMAVLYRQMAERLEHIASPTPQTVRARQRHGSIPVVPPGPVAQCWR
jgi:hypothetical protein